MDRLMTMQNRIFNLLRLFTNTTQRATRTSCVIEWARIIVSKLKEHNVTGLHERQRIVPVAFGDVRSAAAAANRPIDDIDLRTIEEVDQGFSPSPLTISSVAVTIANGGVADKKECR